MSSAGQGRQPAPAYLLELVERRDGRPWVLYAVYAGQKLWLGGFETLGQAMHWIKARELTYGIDMGLPLRVAK